MKTTASLKTQLAKPKQYQMRHLQIWPLTEVVCTMKWAVFCAIRALSVLRSRRVIVNWVLRDQGWDRYETVDWAEEVQGGHLTKGVDLQNELNRAKKRIRQIEVLANRVQAGVNRIQGHAGLLRHRIERVWINWSRICCWTCTIIWMSVHSLEVFDDTPSSSTE